MNALSANIFVLSIKMLFIYILQECKFQSKLVLVRTGKDPKNFPCTVLVLISSNNFCITDSLKSSKARGLLPFQTSMPIMNLFSVYTFKIAIDTLSKMKYPR